MIYLPRMTLKGGFEWLGIVVFTVILIGLLKRSRLIGYLVTRMMACYKQAGHGGSVLHVMKSFILQHFVVVTIVIHSQDIVGSAEHESSSNIFRPNSPSYADG